MKNVRIAVIIISLIFICLSAQMSYNFNFGGDDIPFTAQSLVIFIIAGVLSPPESLICLVSYLLLGILGLPVFAEGASGYETLLGGSGGFLYGFVIIAVLISMLKMQQKPKSLFAWGSIMIMASFDLFVIGVLHLALLYGWDKALEYGFYPFWKMGIIKALLAGLVVYELDHRKIFEPKSIDSENAE